MKPDVAGDSSSIEIYKAALEKARQDLHDVQECKAKSEQRIEADEKRLRQLRAAIYALARQLGETVDLPPVEYSRKRRRGRPQETTEGPIRSIRR